MDHKAASTSDRRRAFRLGITAVVMVLAIPYARPLTRALTSWKAVDWLLLAPNRRVYYFRPFDFKEGVLRRFPEQGDRWCGYETKSYVAPSERCGVPLSESFTFVDPETGDCKRVKVLLDWAFCDKSRHLVGRRMALKGALRSSDSLFEGHQLSNNYTILVTDYEPLSDLE